MQLVFGGGSYSKGGYRPRPCVAGRALDVVVVVVGKCNGELARCRRSRENAHSIHVQSNSSGLL